MRLLRLDRCVAYIESKRSITCIFKKGQTTSRLQRIISAVKCPKGPDWGHSSSSPPPFPALLFSTPKTLLALCETLGERQQPARQCPSSKKKKGGNKKQGQETNRDRSRRGQLTLAVNEGHTTRRPSKPARHFPSFPPCDAVSGCPEWIGSKVGWKCRLLALCRSRRMATPLA